MSFNKSTKTNETPCRVITAIGKKQTHKKTYQDLSNMKNLVLKT